MTASWYFECFMACVICLAGFWNPPILKTQRTRVMKLEANETRRWESSALLVQ